MLSLFIRNLFYTLLQPGVVVGIIPWWLIKNNNNFPENLNLLHFIAALIFMIGLSGLLWCISLFAIAGKGTLSPIDPTQQMVDSGLYCYSRNPMYVCVISMLLAKSLFFRSYTLLIYTLFVFCVFQLFILLHEEPRMLRKFGESYRQYQSQTPRWL
ncbi:MAG: isoprenylcysteine carboxylmethyltransferase family protein [Saprospiraceae bacterium]|nr:isoprenylcysteine carboxylmethyltransferase family protein [Saprospiraceae bacterium]